MKKENLSIDFGILIIRLYFVGGYLKRGHKFVKRNN